MKPEIIITAKGHAGTMATLQSEFSTHLLSEAPDRNAFLKQHAPKVRGLSLLGDAAVSKEGERGIAVPRRRPGPLRAHRVQDDGVGSLLKPLAQDGDEFEGLQDRHLLGDRHDDDAASLAVGEVGGEILDEAPHRAALDDFGHEARRVQQRAQQDLASEPARRPHRRRAARARAAQQVEEHGLGLVVELVRERDRVRAQPREHRAARLARRRLEAPARLRHADAAHGERHAPVAAQLPAEARPGVGVRAQPVVHVHRAQGVAVARREFAQQVKEDHRIDAAGEPGHEMLAAQVRGQASVQPLP